jgi:outer membrane protein TolC
MYLILLLALVAVPAWNQEKLSLEQAVSMALTNHGGIQAGAAALRISEARVAQARGSRFPQVTYTESWQRSDNQVFVFGSLLTQKQFGPTNFDVHVLNDPAFLNNFQSQVIVDQTLYDNGRRKSQIRTAEIGREITAQDTRRTEMEVISSVAAAYYGSLLAAESVRLATETMRSAEADLTRAEARRSAGMTTDADVLSIRVHAAAVREQLIRRQSDLEYSQAALNQALGLPLDTIHVLGTGLIAVQAESTAMAAAEKDAAERPEVKQAQAALEAGEQQARAARAARLPEFYFRAGFEADRQRFVNRGGANWMAAAGFRWNLFDGFADRAREAEAQAGIERVRAQAKLVASGTQLAARRAWLDLQSAGERIVVAKASVSMAQESLRIIKNRYEAGLTEVTELLRSETALLDAQTRHLEAIRDQRIAAVTLEAARGKLNKSSDAVVR